MKRPHRGLRSRGAIAPRVTRKGTLSTTPLINGLVAAVALIVFILILAGRTSVTGPIGPKGAILVVVGAPLR